MRRVKYDERKRVVIEREVGKVTLNIWVYDKPVVILLPVFVCVRSKVSAPFFSALIAVDGMRFVLLKPYCAVSASHIEYLLLRFSITLSLAPIRA